jgi:outer membrane protein
MKKLSLFILLVLFLGVQSIYAQEQKYAHVNLGNVLAEMPEVEQAEQEMQELRDSMRTVYEQRIKDLEQEYGEFQRKVAQGTVPPIEQQQKAQEFQAEQQKLMQFERQLSTKMEERRQKKLAPILEKVDKAIKQVAEENNYKMVFDTSGGSMLYAQDSKDIGDQVKNKLNL